MPLIPRLSKLYPETLGWWWKRIAADFEVARKGSSLQRGDGDASFSLLERFLPPDQTLEARYLLWYLRHHPQRLVPDPFRILLGLSGYHGKPKELRGFRRRLESHKTRPELQGLLDLPGLERRLKLAERPQAEGITGQVFNPRSFLVMRLYDLILPECGKTELASNILTRATGWSRGRIATAVKRARSYIALYFARKGPYRSCP